MSLAEDRKTNSTETNGYAALLPRQFIWLFSK